MAAAADLAHWIRLERSEGVGPDLARRLLAAFGLPGNIFGAGLDALQAVAPKRIAQLLAQPAPPATQQLIEASLGWAEQPGNRILTLADADYPQALLNIPDPPILLYVRGRAELLNRPALAVVGSRNASAQGQANAERFSAALSGAGLTIVSGLALGIDAAAHRGGLSHPAATVAVIGTGADRIYPARNRELAQRIVAQACLISEYPLGMPALAANFPRRNRIISGLARGVLVVEAAERSGSLITARMALEQGRDVFAIPGSIHSPLARGCHQLIRQGATLVESSDDILDEIGAWFAPAPVDTPVNVPARERAPEHALLCSIGHDPIHADALRERTQLDAATISAQLLELELQGRIEMLADGKWQRRD